MRKLAIVLTALMVVLAGCSGGGTTTTAPADTDAPDTTADDSEMDSAETTADDGMDPATTTAGMEGTTTADDGMEATTTADDGMDATPTPDDSPETTTTTDDEMVETTTPDDSMDDTDGSQPAVSNVLSDSSDSDPFANATQIEMTLYNGSQQVDLLIQNDTDSNAQILQLSRDAGTTTLYQTSDYVATRNTTSGEVQYGEPDGNVGFGVSFASALFLFSGLSYASAVEWDEAGTTTVDGTNAFVYEADSLNQSFFENQQGFQATIESGSVQSVDARAVIKENGRIDSIEVLMETDRGTVGSSLVVSYDDISVEKPDWVDESQAP